MSAPNLLTASTILSLLQIYDCLCLLLQSKYNKITNFSRALQEDASCQLLTVLRRFIHKQGTASVELAVSSETIPQLITIQKGILALTRQWKNTLYMPHQLSQYNFKVKKQRPYTVSFAVQGSNSENIEDDDDDDDDHDNDNDDDDEFDDDKISLLEDGAQNKRTGSQQSLNKKRSSGQRIGDASREPVPNVNISRASSMSGTHKNKRHQVGLIFVCWHNIRVAL